MKNFWQKLKKPFYALAPLAGISDSAFRQICKEFGADIMYSEMASATALFYDAKKRKNINLSETLKLALFEEKERPFVVQLFGSEPEHFKAAVELIHKQIKPDGIDINFGCPVKKVRKQGAGAALMADLKKSYEVIKATVESTDLPISIKTRTKAGDVDILRFLDYISDLDVKAIMIHGRSLSQMFSGDIDTAVMKKARDFFPGIIMANGGVYSYEDAARVLNETEADGLGIARGALGRPWIFKALRTGQSVERQKSAVFKIAIKHAELARKQKGEKGIIETRKHLCWYIYGFSGASKMREELVKVSSLDDVRNILSK
ncbi:MAG: tRNA-dihydrouridine synthase [Patescibacteria group bacterium]|nr:tRNA-dihydrouridine synthase [Patescibacteria group bacterium]